MAKERKYSREKIERSLDIVSKNLKEKKPLSASRALTVALNYARFYKGPDRNFYLGRIEEAALTLEQDRTLEDYQYEHVQGIEEAASAFKRGYKHPINELLPAIIGAGGLIAGLFFLSPNITGNVIGNLTNSNSNIIGVVLLVLGLGGTFFFFNPK